MDFISKPNHIFESESIEDILVFYSNPSAFPELEDKIFSDYAVDPKYFECCETNSKYSNLMQNDFKIYYKLTEYNFKSRGFDYKLGLNIDTKPFNPSGCCSGGGLYFCELENLHQFENYGNYLTPIVIPRGIPVYKETHTSACSHPHGAYEKLKAPCIYVLPRMRIDNPEVNKFICQSSPLNMRFINCLLYKSENSKDLKDFMNYTYTKQFWSNEIKNAKIKLLMHNYFESPRKDYHSLRRIFENGIVFDKKFINFLIDHGMPNLIQHNDIHINPIDRLNLEPFGYSKWFTTAEKEIFSECNIVVAGSSVLRYLTNKKFRPNDIDLYITADNLSKLINSKVFDSISDDKSAKSNYNMKNIVGVKKIKTKIKTVDQYGYEKTCKKIYQLIVLYKDPAEFIKSNFDFDLCAIGYSFAYRAFVNIVEKPEYSILTIQPSYINKMCGTETDSYSGYRARKTFGRIQKYLSRGFSISNWKEFLEAIKNNMC